MLFWSSVCINITVKIRLESRRSNRYAMTPFKSRFVNRAPGSDETFNHLDIASQGLTLVLHFNLLLTSLLIFFVEIFQVWHYVAGTLRPDPAPPGCCPSPSSDCPAERRRRGPSASASPASATGSSSPWRTTTVSITSPFSVRSVSHILNKNWFL